MDIISTVDVSRRLLFGGVLGTAAPTAAGAPTAITTANLDAEVAKLVPPTAGATGTALTARLPSTSGIRDAAQLGVRSSAWSSKAYGNENTAILQALINELATDKGGEFGGVVLLPAGLIYHTGLTLRIGVTLAGRGHGATTLVLMPNVATSSITIARKEGKTPAGVDATANAIGRLTVIRDLTLHGGERDDAPVPPASSHGILILPSNATMPDGKGKLALPGSLGADHGIIISDVLITAHGGDGITATRPSGLGDELMSGTSDVATGENHFVNVMSLRNRGAGFRPGFDTYLVACTAGGNEGDGFVIASGNTMLSSCKSYMSGNVRMEKPEDAPLLTKYTNKASVGFSILTNGKSTLVGCIAQNNAADGFRIAADNVTMQGCIADANNMAEAENGTDAFGVRIVGARLCTIDVACATKGQQNEEWMGKQLNSLALRKNGETAPSLNSIRLSGWKEAVQVDDASVAFLPGNDITINAERVTERTRMRHELAQWTAVPPKYTKPISPAFEFTAVREQRGPDGCEATVLYSKGPTIAALSGNPLDVAGGPGSLVLRQGGIRTGDILLIWPVQLRAVFTEASNSAWSRGRTGDVTWTAVWADAKGVPLPNVAAIASGKETLTSGERFVGSAAPLRVTADNAAAAAIIYTASFAGGRGAGANATIYEWIDGDALTMRVTASTLSQR